MGYVLDEEILSSNFAIFDIISKTFVLGCCQLPRVSPSPHSEINNTGGPDIHKPWVKRLCEILLWGDIRR